MTQTKAGRLKGSAAAQQNITLSRRAGKVGRLTRDGCGAAHRLPTFPSNASARPCRGGGHTPKAALFALERSRRDSVPLAAGPGRGHPAPPPRGRRRRPGLRVPAAPGRGGPGRAGPVPGPAGSMAAGEAGRAADKLFSLSGLFAVYKPKGPTSAGVLNLLKERLLAGRRPGCSPPQARRGAAQAPRGGAQGPG